MDGTTEPIIAVIGHPIAGNPNQFAIERALESLDLDWRVLSFDVHPEHIAAALEGFKVTGIAGVIIDSSVMSVASRWYATKGDADLGAIDCLYRDDDLNFRASHEERCWLDEMIARHTGGGKHFIGDPDVELPIDLNAFSTDERTLSPSPDVITGSELIVIGPESGGQDSAKRDAQGPGGLEMDEWPTDDGSTLVIDLSLDTLWQAEMVALGYRVVTSHQRRVSTLVRCVKRWTGHDASADVISDAIEEYLGV